MKPKDKMRAVTIAADHGISIATMPVPEPGPDEILVSPACCGICGTDLHIVRHGYHGTRYPVIPGHEFAGHVVAVGRDVTGIREGDFVAVDPNVSCGKCKWCRQGRPNLCEALVPIGVARPGAFADYVAVPARTAYQVPEALGHDVAAMIEPLACVLNALWASRGVTGKSVLIMGAGTMGLLLAVVCQREGAEVTVCDPMIGKHEVARRAGIKRVLAPDALGDECFEVVFEAAGAGPALSTAYERVATRGTLVEVGVHGEASEVALRPFRIFETEMTIVGSNSLADKFPEAVERMPDFAEEAKALVTDTYSAWSFAEAVENMAKGRSVKTLLTFPDRDGSA
ncbi:MAG: alcohol dehydrogenase catalytic domain-containing protein [Tropicimonas sp.]|uniref:alcohol dehydrogenase catalytic domain-containing protein n=1 Tax=Tropicimonas sp. TaxID=2067044 RepID=UPI003A85B41C